MKMKFFFLLILSCFWVKSVSSQQLGWAIRDVIRLKGENYQRKPGKGSFYVIQYGEKMNINEQNPSGYDEFYTVDSTSNKVIRYVFLGIKSESDVVEIIERNNSKLRKVDLGSKQNYYQWINLENNAEYTLKIEMEMDGKKYIFYMCSIKD